MQTASTECREHGSRQIDNQRHQDMAGKEKGDDAGRLLHSGEARAGGRHVHWASSIQIGSARPTIVVVGNGPKYRPSSDATD